MQCYEPDRDLTRLIREKPMTESDLQWASLFVLDTLGCALGALPTEPGRMLKAVAPPAQADTARKAFYLGGLSHILEMDDLHRDSVTHPGSVVIPAAWAVAHDRDLGGEAFLRGSRGIRSLLPRRHVRWQEALPGLAQHLDLRAVRRGLCRGRSPRPR